MTGRLWPAGSILLIQLLLVLPAFAGQTKDPWAAQVARANKALQQGNLDAAEQAIGPVLKARPDHAEALNMLGVIRAQQQRSDEAEELFRRAIKANPRLAGPYGNLGILYRNKNDVNQALQMLQRAAELSPRDARILHNLARLQSELGNFPEAIQRLNAVPVKERTGEYWLFLGSAYLSNGDYLQAEDALKKVLAGDPESISTLRQLAGVALKRNDTEAAWKYMVRARNIAPNSPDLLHEYAQISLRNGLAAEAIVAMRKAILLEPDRSEFLFFLATALMESPMEFHEAVPYFEQYVKTKPEDPDGHGSLGWAYYATKNFEKARNEIEESLRLQPDRLVAYYQLGMIAYETGDNATALRLLSHGVERQPDNADARLALGMVYVREGRFDRAREAFEASARLNPEEPKVHYQLSQVYRRLGDAQAASREAAIYQEKLKRFRDRNERSVSLPSVSIPMNKPDKH